MNLTLWIIASLLAVVFLFAGANKLFIVAEASEVAQAAGCVPTPPRISLASRCRWTAGRLVHKERER